HGRVPHWIEITDHDTYDGFWTSRNILPHVRDIQPAVLVVGGWYDAYDLYGALHLFDAVTRQSPATPLIFVMGPWTHGQWSGKEDGSRVGALEFRSKTAQYFETDIELPFFESHLKQDRSPAVSGVMAFETGANRWHGLKRWPPAAVKETPIYLRESGKL